MAINENNFSAKAKDDLELVRRAVESNDQQAYAELLSRYRESIFHVILKMVNDRDDADDLTIETFAKAFRSLPAFRPDFAFSTWLFKIATNAGIDHIRKKKLSTFSIDKTIKESDGDEYQVTVADNSMDPEEELISGQKALMLRSFVDSLKPRYKRLIELRYYEQLSYEEISDKLEMPLGTVKAQLFRARDLLHQVMKNKKDYL